MIRKTVKTFKINTTLISLIVGLTMAGAGMWHLLSDNDPDGYTSHDIVVGVVIVLGVGLAFTDKVSTLLYSWKGTKEDV